MALQMAHTHYKQRIRLIVKLLALHGAQMACLEYQMAFQTAHMRYKQHIRLMVKNCCPTCSANGLLGVQKDTLNGPYALQVAVQPMVKLFVLHVAQMARLECKMAL